MSQPQDTFESQTAAELDFGWALVSGQRRAAGLVTLGVVGLWSWFTALALSEVGQAIIMTQIGVWMELNQPVEVPIDAQRRVESPEDARELLRERIESRKALREARRRELQGLGQRIAAEVRVQKVAIPAWAVVMIVSGVILLCAALAGLAGSPHTRRWHLAAAKWVILSAAGTAAAVFVLARWGGFPLPDDYWYLAEILVIQIAYGLVILIALAATGRHGSAAPADRDGLGVRLQAQIPAPAPASVPPP